MSDATNFGKQAANAWGAAGTLARKAITSLTGAGTPAAKAVSPANVAQAGRQMPAPAMPPAPPKLPPKPSAAATATPPKLTPAEMQGMSRMHAAGQGYTLPTNQAPVAVRAMQQNADAAMRARLNAGGGTPQELQQVMGPQFREYTARVAGAGKAQPAMPPPPPPRFPVKSGAAKFGRKVANRVDFYERAPKDETKKKLPDHEIFNNALMRAEAAGEKPSAELFNSIGSEYKEKAKKEAKSKCVPCDSGMYKNYDRGVYQTGPMQAMDADEAISKANGGVEATEETEHAEKDIHNSGQKSAYAFGWKVAQFNVFGPELFTGPDKPGMTPFPRQAAPARLPAAELSPDPFALFPDGRLPFRPAGEDQSYRSSGSPARASAPASSSGRQPLLKPIGDQPGKSIPPPDMRSSLQKRNLSERLADGLEKIMELEQQAKAKQPRRPFDDNYKPATPPPARKSAPVSLNGQAIPARAPAPAPTSAKSFGQQAYDMLGTAGNAISSGVSAVNDARLSTGKAIGEGAHALSAYGPELWTGPAKPGMTPGYKAPKADAPKADAPKADAPGAASGLAGLPWGAIGGAGLGAAGLSALAYHLMSKKKKKKQDGSDEEG